RVYVFSDGRLEQLTQDDSWVATVLAHESTKGKHGRDKDEIAQHPMRHVLTNVLGAREYLDMEVTERPIAAGEVFLLCSDGLHGALDDAVLASVLGSAGTAQEMAAELVRRALDVDGSDNVTALVVRVE